MSDPTLPSVDRRAAGGASGVIHVVGVSREGAESLTPRALAIVEKVDARVVGQRLLVEKVKRGNVTVAIAESPSR